MSERPLTKPMRAILVVGGLFVLAAAIQLYPLAKHTEDYFAWTIAIPATAAFLGASYAATTVLALMSARESTWARARLGLPGVLAFIWLTLLMTLLHLDTFHFDSDQWFARGVAWVWLAIYALEPPILTWIYVKQLREPGADPPRDHPLPRWYRAALAALAAVLVLGGIALFALPGEVGDAWPWPLTDLTAQAIAAWLVAFGLLLGAIWWENDWTRVGLGMALLITLVALLALALALFPDKVESGNAIAGYIAGLAALGAIALYGLVRSQRVAQPTD